MNKLYNLMDNVFLMFSSASLSDREILTDIYSALYELKARQIQGEDVNLQIGHLEKKFNQLLKKQ